MKQLLTLTTVVAFALSLAGCPADDEKNDRPTTNTGDPRLTAITGLRDAYCGYLLACDGQIANFFATEADCADAMNAEMDDMLAEDPQMTAANISACAAAITALESSCTWQVFSNLDYGIPQACLDMENGTAPVGSDCSANGDLCAPELFCAEYPDAANGNPVCPTCTPRLGLGQGCDWDGQCQQGMECAQDLCATITAPATLLAVGATCTDHEECASYLCKDGSCGVAPRETEACLEDWEVPCALPLVCDNGVCTRVTFPIAQGEACGGFGGDFYDTLVECASGNVCRWNNTDQELQCLPLLADGQGPCDWSGDCAADLYCNYSTDLCDTYVALSGSCSNAQCDPDQGYCDYNTYQCAPFLTAGQACASSYGWCADGLYCDYDNTGNCTAYVALAGACTDDEQCEDFNCFDGACAAWETCQMP